MPPIWRVLGLALALGSGCWVTNSELRGWVLDSGDLARSDSDSSGERDDSGDTTADSDPADGSLDEDADGDGFSAREDCDDQHPGVFPGAVEACDGRDTDCDGRIDLPVPPTAPQFHPDADGDGFGDDRASVQACASPGAGWVGVGGDCDDQRSDVSPAAHESCDSQDTDCDGEVDEAGALGCSAWYTDGDGDGFGVDTSARCLCRGPVAGWTASRGGDCYDLNPTVNPTAGGWFTVHRGDGSFDYNCDGVQTQQETRSMQCGLTGSVCDGTTCRLVSTGWQSTLPQCGQVQQFGGSCVCTAGVGCAPRAENTNLVTQGCH